MKEDCKNNVIKNLLLNQKGMALLTTLIFVFLLVTFGVALLTMTSNDIKLSTLQRDSTKAFYLAEAGVDKALWNLNTSTDKGGEGLDWPADGVVTLTEGTANEYYEVTAQYYPVEQTDTIKINSVGTVKVGKYSSGKRKIEVMLKKAISPSSTLCYNYALGAESNINLIGNITIDGDIHSNGTVEGSKNIQNITGELTTGGNELYPKIDFDYYKQLAIDNGTYYEKYTKPPEFDNGGTITGIYFIDDDVDIKGNTILNIQNGTIFATGEITSSGNVVITHTKSETYNNPLALVAKGDITLGGTVSTEGVIQSNGDIKVNGTVDVLSGAIVADNVTVVGNVSVTYDPDLWGEVVVGTGIEIYKKISWRELY